MSVTFHPQTKKSVTPEGGANVGLGIEIMVCPPLPLVAV